MGVYLNPGATMLRRGRASGVYVDKSPMIAHLNRVLNTERLYACVSRPRRFGKTMAANMVSAYYDRTVDGAAEFAGLAIAEDPSFEANRNRFDVLKLNIQDFLSETRDVPALLERLQRFCCAEIAREYPDVPLFDPGDLPTVMSDVFYATGRQFVVVIDEWDCVMRETPSDCAGQRLYHDFLRSWLKDRPCIALCYMTGILPIKKFGTQSALNMFDEYSMVSPMELAPSMGFTESEVAGLCERWGRNLDGLRDKVTRLAGGMRVPVNTETFANDMTTFGSADDVLTLLVHLGYLAYDAERREVFVPNREIAGEYANAMRLAGWDEVTEAE